MQYRFATALCLAATTCLAGTAHAQDAASYPSKPVRVMVALAPGGAVDIQARLFSQKLTESLRQPFVVENRPSAGGADAFGLVAKAAPDGHTLLAVNPSFTLPQDFSKNLPDPVKDFAPISLLTRAPLLLVVHPSVPVKSARDWLALARARPGQLNFGGSPNGSQLHLGALWFFSLAKIKVAYIPYKGTGPAMIALLGGETDVSIVSIVSVGAHVKSGRLRALGVTSMQRSQTMPNLPSIAEQGVPGFDYISFFGFVAPAGTPAAIVNKLSSELARTIHNRELADKLKDDGAEPVGGTPDEFRQFIAAEVPRWRKIVQDNGIKSE